MSHGGPIDHGPTTEPKPVRLKPDQSHYEFVANPPSPWAIGPLSSAYNKMPRTLA